MRGKGQAEGATGSHRSAPTTSRIMPRLPCVCLCEDHRRVLESPSYSTVYFLVVAVQSLSHVQLLATPRTVARQASLFLTISRSSPKFTSIESVLPGVQQITCVWGGVSAQVRPTFIYPGKLSFLLNQEVASESSRKPPSMDNSRYGG